MKIFNLIISFFLFYLLSCDQSKDPVTVVKLLCNQSENPTVINSTVPKFSWQLISDSRNQAQSAYHILVADNLDAIQNSEGNIWDSKKANTDKSILVKFKGKELKSAKKYYWKVKVWNQTGIESDWSQPTYFVTALFNAKDWSNAQWLVYKEMPESLRLVPGIHGLRRDFKKCPGTHGQKRYVTPYFRKEFVITKKVRTAFVAVSGLGNYELSLNGEKVGNRFLAPGWTNYDKTCLYNMYEVTDQLQKGKNALGGMVGNGFYNINTERYIKFAITYGSPTLICKLKIEYEDGTEEVIISDESWKTDNSPITFTSIFGGEDYDANLEQAGWDAPGFNDSGWGKALVSSGPKGELKVETTRSDCHAWGASPNIEFFRIVLGIESDAPYFEKVKIEPHLGAIKKISGEMPHPAGKISVDYNVSGNELNADIKLPAGITGTFVWKGKNYELKGGENFIKL